MLIMVAIDHSSQYRPIAAQHQRPSGTTTTHTQSGESRYTRLSVYPLCRVLSSFPRLYICDCLFVSVCLSLFFFGGARWWVAFLSV